MKNSIPIDLIYEILSRLPAKSVARCRCVSKQWRSILRRQDFTELFLTRSKARPRLLISVQQDGKWSFLSLPQPQNHYENSSLVVAATDFHTKFSSGISLYSCSYASGLIYFHNMHIPKEDVDPEHVLCDPLTGQYVILPELGVGHSVSYLGFDPIDKEFKVLFMNTSDYIASNDVDHYILTLGAGELKWRKIRCPFTHEPVWNRICINGVLYYLAISSNGLPYVLVCFDVRSEKFKLLDIEYRYGFDGLINYKGKLCGINLEYAYHNGFPVKLTMRVLEDVEKPEWSKHDYSLWVESKVGKVNYNLSVSGMTATGDIVLSMKYVSNPCYVFYFNPERNTLQVQSVEIQGLGANRDCISYYAFVDYVEDLSVNDAMLQLKSSPLLQGRNIVTKRPKPKQRRHTSRDLSKSAPSVKNKHQNKYKFLANMLYHSVGLAILFFVLFVLFF
ncbi:F-box associated interaction domain [Arabidopsis suecica]|uniref:F-box associated interaction domain n=1 Tax=Arabidopsis suecica TaxID=45249 RepID=A0A8T2CH41_ARASU|nr:F-box associated interaction domain [Arabidopsis suecica]